jgi:hypothetical protein
LGLGYSVAGFGVIYDACLFYPAPPRDLMIRLAQTRRFRARWTHVLAAAIRGGAQTIVTTSRKDFPRESLADFDMTPRHPDNFILDLADLDLAIVTTAAKCQRAALKNPPFSAEIFVDTLRRQGLPGVAGFLQSQIGLI